MGKQQSLDITDNHDGTVTIEGTRYSYEFFKEFGCSFPNMVGQVLRIESKSDGLVTVSRLVDQEKE